MAVTMVLLAAALLLGRTLLNLLRAGPGFNTAHLLTVQLWMGGTRYTTSAALADFYRSLEAQLERMPGVRSAAVVSCGMPLEIGGNMPAAIETVRQVQSMDLRAVSDGYFQTLGVPVLAGRGFDAADTGSSAPVAVINKEFAREYFGNRNPLGLHVVIGATMKNTPYLEPPREIVGVVGDVKSRLNFPPEPTVFVSNEQANRATVELFDGFYPVELLVRGAGDPLLLGEPVRKSVASLDASVPVGKIETMEQVRASSVGVERFLLAMMGIFAVLALALSAVGIYGVLAYTVAQRSSEIGLRMALGATPADVLRMMLGQTARLAATGIALGACIALALTRMLGSVLYGVGTADPLSFAATAALLAAAALAACAIPSWRAMRLDPVVALRHE
jgi:putative ABC transport system permease protein